MKIFCPEFWPFFKTSERRRFDYTAIDGSMPPLSSVFSYDAATDSMLYDDYDAAGTWRDRWFYQYRPGFGVAEWRDDYPLTGWLAAIFGPAKRVVMSPPIGWGEYAEIGGGYGNSPVMDPWRSTPPQFSSGKQSVLFEALLPELRLADGTVYRDVLQLLYQQKWGTGVQAGARYWMSRGVGPVALQWVAPDPHSGQIITTARMDARVTTEILR